MKTVLGIWFVFVMFWALVAAVADAIAEGREDKRLRKEKKR